VQGERTGHWTTVPSVFTSAGSMDRMEGEFRVCTLLCGDTYDPVSVEKKPCRWSRGGRQCYYCHSWWRSNFSDLRTIKEQETLHNEDKSKRDSFMQGRATLIQRKKDGYVQGVSRRHKRTKVAKKQGYSADIVEKTPFYYWPDYLRLFGHPRNNGHLNHKICRHPVNKKKGVLVPRNPDEPIMLEQRWFDTTEKEDTYLSDADSAGSHDADDMLDRMVASGENQINKSLKGSHQGEMKLALEW